MAGAAGRAGLAVELWLIVAAIAVGAFVKGVTGSGLPQIAIPVMATFLGVERAVVIMAIPGIVSNAWLLWANRDGLTQGRDLPALLVAGIVGSVAGTMLLKTLDARLLALILAAMIVVYIAAVTLRPGFTLPPRVTRITSPPVGLLAGGLQGATGVSGPLLTTYLHGFGLAPSAFIFSLSTLFVVFSVVQTVTLFSIGLYPPARVAESLLALVPIAVLLPLGSRVARRMSAAAFQRVILVLLVVTAMKLVYDAVAG